MHERVIEEGGATWAAVVATCAQVFMRVVGLVGVMAFCSCNACCLCWCSRLDNSAANVAGLLLDLVMVAQQGRLIGLTVGISVGTLGIGACGCMELIHLLSLVWGMGMLTGACTHGTCCVLQKIVWGNGFFKLVGICLYASLCCVNNML
jgi:hypothetical protein